MSQAQTVLSTTRLAMWESTSYVMQVYRTRSIAWFSSVVDSSSTGDGGARRTDLTVALPPHHLLVTHFTRDAIMSADRRVIYYLAAKRFGSCPFVGPPAFPSPLLFPPRCLSPCSRAFTFRCDLLGEHLAKEMDWRAPRRLWASNTTSEERERFEWRG